MKNAFTVLCLTALGATSLQGAMIFSDNFDGGVGDLDGTTPDTTTGASWVASPTFNANGSTDDGAGSATLSFAPASGFIYTLSASWVGLSANPADTDWFGMGFVNGQSTTSTNNDRFITGNVVGGPWMMTRGDFNLTTNQAFLGNGQLGTGNNGLGPGGVNNGVAWSLSPAENAVDLRIVLDTTAGATLWTATWYAKRPGDSSYTEVRPTQVLYAPTTITAVGLARSNPGVSGTVTSFTLTSVVPEPSAACLLGLGGLALLSRRRRRSFGTVS